MRLKTLARERDKAEVLHRLRSVRPDSPARWGRMSAHQMVCHLGDAFRMATGEKVVRYTRGSVHRAVLKWIALYAPLPWPGGIPTSPEIDQERFGTRPVDFAADLNRVEALTDFVTSRPADFPWQGHPVFGPMSTADWLRWGYLHLDHHLRQFGT